VSVGRRRRPVAAARRVGAIHANASMPDVLALTSPPRRGPACRSRAALRSPPAGPRSARRPSGL